MKPIREALTELLTKALASESCEAGRNDVAASFEIPREEKFGDLSSSIALQLAKRQKTNPRAFSEKLRKTMTDLLAGSELGGRIAKLTVEGPGFINFYYSNSQITRVLEKIEKEKDAFGKPRDLKARRVLLEFVSANPTGPLTVAHGRQAALGDSLARILSFCGHKVHKEYYNNDEGVQIRTLGESTALRAEELLGKKEMDFPENYYRGAYLKAVAEKLLKEKKPQYLKMDREARVDFCARFGREEISKGIREDLEDFGVRFDNFYSQEALGKSGKVEKTIELLKKEKAAYEKDGALWFQSTRWNDDKDRVLIKSDKSYTYFTPDIAYHHDKFERGFDELINIWGPDHHGYIARLKASQAALGRDPARIKILIAQLVTLYEGKKQVRMSTRAGEFITLRQVLDEVGRDAGRFFYLMRRFDAHLDFDLTLAKSQTSDNPVFYIQYAHARIESIKKMCREKGLAAKADPRAVARLTEEAELKVMRRLWQFEEALRAAERTLEPYRVVAYLRELAAGFHKFYTEHRVLSEDASLTQARLTLVLSVQTVLRSGLELLGVSAPLKM